MLTPPFIHDLIHRAMPLDHPHAHWWIDLVTVLVLIVAPAWTAWLAVRFGLRCAFVRLDRGRMRGVVPSRGPASIDAVGSPGPRKRMAVGLEAYVVRATSRLQFRLVLLSILTLPAAWLLLEIPKHIINHALSDAEGDGHPGMAFLGLELGRVELLFALCASYLAVLTLGGLAKYAVNRTRGGLNERLVRRLRLAVFRRARGERSPERRAALAAVAVQEVEPIGYAAQAWWPCPSSRAARS